MFMRFMIPCCLFLLFVTTLGRAGEIVYQAQNRFIEATLDFDGQSERRSAADFGHFENSISAFGSASQTSTLLPNSIFAMSRVSGATGPPVGTSSGGGQSRLSVDFNIPHDSEYELDFTMRNVEFGSYRFSGSSLDLVDLEANFLRPVDIHESGPLLAGTYSFEVDISNGGAAEGFVGEFSLQFNVVPEPTAPLQMFGIAALVFLCYPRHRPRTRKK